MPTTFCQGFFFVEEGGPAFFEAVNRGGGDGRAEVVTVGRFAVLEHVGDRLEDVEGDQVGFIPRVGIVKILVEKLTEDQFGVLGCDLRGRLEQRD